MMRGGKSYLRLWASILQKAIKDLYYELPATTEHLTNCQDSQIKRELYWKEQAQAWFKNNSDEFNSFKGVCMILGLDPSEIRKKLHEDGLL
jgi:hypothetical protein